VKAIALFALAVLVPTLGKAATVTVELDGSGDYVVLQDAINAAASGDTVLVGPGRHDTFRAAQSVVNGFEFQGIAWLVGDLTLIGQGAGTTFLGPSVVSTELEGLPTCTVFVDGGSESTVSGFTIDGTQYPMILRNRSTVTMCHIDNPSDISGIAVSAGDGIEILNCTFNGRSGVFARTPDVTNLLVENCQFIDDGQGNYAAMVIGNSAQDAMIRNCLFRGYAEGVEFSLSATGTIDNCDFEDITVGALDLSSGSVVMTNCRVEAGARFSLGVNIGSLDLRDSIIGGGTLATLLVSGLNVTIRDSHLLNGGGLTVDSIGPADRVIDLAGNWWGTADENLIESWIRDANGNVTFLPILDGPLATQSRSIGSVKGSFGDQ